MKTRQATKRKSSEFNTKATEKQAPQCDDQSASKRKKRRLSGKQSSENAEIKSGLKARPRTISCSSESSLEEYMTAAVDFKPVCNISKNSSETEFSAIESSILAGVTRLSDSDSDTDNMNHENKALEPLSNQVQISHPQVSPKTDSKPQGTQDANILNVSQILALGEGAASHKLVLDPGSASDASSDWEEVAEQAPPPAARGVGVDGIEITLAASDIQHKRRKKGRDIEAYMQRQLNRVKRDIQVLVHKVSLLCWLAHGNFLNATLNSDVLMGQSLSLVPSQHCYPPRHLDLSYLEKFVSWFRRTVILSELPSVSEEPLAVSLQHQLSAHAAHSPRDLVLLFVCTLRSLGVQTRLVLSLQPLPLRPQSHELCNFVRSKSPSSPPDAGHGKQSKHPTAKKARADGDKSARKVTKQAGTKNGASSKQSVTAGKSDRSLRNRSDAKVKKCVGKQKDLNKSHSSDSDSVEETSIKGKPKEATSKCTGNKKATSSKACGAVSGKGQTKAKLSGSSSKSKLEDDDFKPEQKTTSRHSKSRQAPGRGRQGVDTWVEVFVEEEEAWVSIDVLKGRIHCAAELRARATQPVSYVLAWGNDHSIKDVTVRYCAHVHSSTRRLRVEPTWWASTLRPFRGRRSPREREEDEELERALADCPLPSSIGEFKNHPLYVLSRHLLKYQAIYPADAPPLGYVRGEPVYARECVKELHSRESWLKEAKVVRLGEQPYKVVKARPKMDKMTGHITKDLPLELFGLWQVEDYMPPVAVDGKVPRNEYGNVDLFKPSMLPRGCVHLQVPCLNRVARKLNIDCAPATTGFDFHSGSCHPTFDGFVVCEEFKDILLDAWNQEQDEADRRAQEKREKRVYGNWRRLIKGLLIRERLKARYAFGEGPSGAGSVVNGSRK